MPSANPAAQAQEKRSTGMVLFQPATVHPPGVQPAKRQSPPSTTQPVLLALVAQAVPLPSSAPPHDGGRYAVVESVQDPLCARRGLGLQLRNQRDDMYVGLDSSRIISLVALPHLFAQGLLEHSSTSTSHTPPVYTVHSAAYSAMNG